MAMVNLQESGLDPVWNRLTLHFLYFCCGTNPGCWKSRLPLNRIIFVLEDEDASWLEDGREIVPLRPGSVILVPAFREITHHQSKSMRHLSIHFNLEFYPGADLLAGRERCWQDSAADCRSSLQRLLRQREPLTRTITLRMLCWQVLAAYWAAEAEPVSLWINRCLFYAPLFSHLERNCHAGVDVAGMAAVMNMSRESFSRRFFGDTGQSPKQYFNQLLVARAARLLMRPDMTVRKTAFELKFCNEFYFSRFFKKHLGVSPRDYRKRGLI